MFPFSFGTGVESFDANVGVMGTMSIGEDAVIHALTEPRLQAQWCDQCNKFDISIDRRFFPIIPLAYTNQLFPIQFSLIRSSLITFPLAVTPHAELRLPWPDPQTFPFRHAVAVYVPFSSHCIRPTNVDSQVSRVEIDSTFSYSPFRVS